MLEIRAMESYEPPRIPTFGEDNSVMLKKLPNRWKNNAKVLACIGIMGTVTLAGCLNSVIPNDDYRLHNGGAAMPIYVTRPTEQELNFRLHGGGGGSAFYVVYFTEQEAFGIIRAKLEEAGLNFGATPPGYTVDVGWVDSVGIDLFDRQRNVAVTHITREMNNQPFFSHGGSRLANEVAREFSSQNRNIAFGVFYTPEWFPGFEAMDDWVQIDDENWEVIPHVPPTDEEIAEAKKTARPILVGNLSAQVDEFIEFLRSERIL